MMLFLVKSSLRIQPFEKKNIHFLFITVHIHTKIGQNLRIW